MTKTMWTSIPAGVLGQGSADVRAYRGVVVCPTPEAVQGTGLPAVGFAADVPAAGDVARLRATHAPTAQQFIDLKFTQNDGTTLGFHPSSRPLS